jgi:hypothetical protein
MFRHLFFFTLIAVAVTNSSASGRWFKGYRFESYVISDLGYRYHEIERGSGAHIQVEKDDEYSLVVNNPLPVRVAVAVTIDGLNVINGKRTSPSKAAKWIIEPYGTLTLRGWQTDHSSLRRFVFTDKYDSYAEWKGKQDRKNYTRNLGIIGVAYFWNSRELGNALRPPQPFARRCPPRRSLKKSRSGCSPRPMDDCAKAESEAGTGMGVRETNNVVDVAFHYDTGMYRTSDILTINYEFACRIPRYPRPFKNDYRYDHGHFAPEMP